MRLTVCGYQYVFLSQKCWMENSSITPCRRSPQRKKPSFPQMLERVTWPITLHSWFLSESRLHRLFFSFSIKAFRENLLPRDSPLVHLYVMLFCAGCFKMRYEFDDSFTLWFDLTMHLQGPLLYMYHIIAVWCCVFQEVRISCSCSGYVSSWWYLTSPLDGGYIQCTFQLTEPQKSIFDSADRWSACVYVYPVYSQSELQSLRNVPQNLAKTLTIVSSVLCDGRIMRRIYALLWPPMQTFISCQVVITDKCWCHKEWRLFGQILTKL